MFRLDKQTLVRCPSVEMLDQVMGKLQQIADPKRRRHARLAESDHSLKQEVCFD
jgi:hypothetical protein